MNSTEWHNKAHETYGDDEKPPAYTSDMFAARGDSPTGSCTKVPLTRPGTADTCSKRRLSAAKPEVRNSQDMVSERSVILTDYNNNNIYLKSNTHKSSID